MQFESAVRRLFELSPATHDYGRRAPLSILMCWQMTNRPALLILVYWIYIYIYGTDGTLNDRPMNDNLRIVALCCLPGLNSGRRQSLILFGADRHHSTLYITLVMIWLRVLPHGMDGCSPQNYYLFFSVLFLGLVIFQSPLFPDEVDPYTEFQTSLIKWFTSWVWDCFSSSLILHMWYYSAYFCCATAIWADVSRCILCL